MSEETVTVTAPEVVTFNFESFDQGRLIAQLSAAFQEAATDVLDPGKDREAKRELSLKMTLVPNKGSGFDVKYVVGTKLAPKNPGETYCEFGRAGTVTTVNERKYDQLSLAEGN